MSSKKTEKTEKAENIENAEKKVEEILYTIEELKEKNKVSNPVYKGVLVETGWIKGKLVTEATFLKAVDDFLKKPVDGGKHV